MKICIPSKNTFGTYLRFLRFTILPRTDRSPLITSFIGTKYLLKCYTSHFMYPLLVKLEYSIIPQNFLCHNVLLKTPVLRGAAAELDLWP